MQFKCIKLNIGLWFKNEFNNNNINESLLLITSLQNIGTDHFTENMYVFLCRMFYIAEIDPDLKHILMFFILFSNKLY